jgi:hypothetical protein
MGENVVSKRDILFAALKGTLPEVLLRLTFVSVSVVEQEALEPYAVKPEMVKNNVSLNTPTD